MDNTEKYEKLTDPAYDILREYVLNRRKRGDSWDKIYNLGFIAPFKTFEEWESFHEYDSPSWMTVTQDEFLYLVKMTEEAERERERLGSRGDFTILANDNELNMVKVPTNPGSCWQTYKKTLRNSGFSIESVDRLEKQVLEILKHLSSKETKVPIKGLVVGNVQSGKTSAMAGLMAMAADYGWNYFIVLTGLNDNLRKQTELRLRKELELDKSRNLVWDYIDYSRLEDKNYNYEHFSDSRRVFFSVVLKQKDRLPSEIKFLQKAPNPGQIKMLIIDDEADQGSMNTGDVEKGIEFEEKEKKSRSDLNRKILCLVYGKNVKGQNPKKFGAMNYVSFTATPYANCLNEFKSEANKPTLYPEDFICRLEPGRGYFGPDVIFGDTEEAAENTLNIVNTIDDDQVGMIRAIEKEESMELPESLKDAVAWFLCAASVFRLWNFCKPVSMLIHVNHLTIPHERLYRAVYGWLKQIPTDSMIQRCWGVYVHQTGQFKAEDLCRVYPDYEFLSEVRDYPAFDVLIPYLKELLKNITSIQVEGEEKELIYDKSLLICVDNSENNGVDSEGKHMRLVYPNRQKLDELGFAPAFLVIGGTTLSRGLTLEGLVSSYFLRKSVQADTLMQMGRWFGYRKGYELLPRIWMTKKCYELFQFLVDIDKDLRNQIDQMAMLGKKPTDYVLSLLTYPKASWLRLTATNKMQRSKKIELDFSGTDMQLVAYRTDSQIVKHNNGLIENFLKDLGEPEYSELNNTSGIWRNVDYSRIDQAIFEKGFDVVENSRAFQKMGVLRQWIEEQTKKGNFRSWTVILAGSQAGSDPDKNYKIPGTDFTIGKVNRSAVSGGEDYLNIKVLTNKADYVAHLKEDDFRNPKDPEFTWNALKSEGRISAKYNQYIESAGAEQIPLLLIYCVDKNSVPRKNTDDPEKQKRMPLADFGLEEDILGLAMFIPGKRGSHAVKVRIDERFYSSEGDDTDAD